MQTTNVKQVNNRPILLTVLCVLSFMGGALDILTGVFKIIFGRINASLEGSGNFQLETFSNGIEAIPLEFQETFINVTIRYFNSLTVSGLILFLLALISIYGVYKMWDLNKKGFYFYLFAQLLILIIPFYAVGLNIFGVVSFFLKAFFTVMFVILYASQLSKMS